MASTNNNAPKIKDRTIEDFKGRLIGGAARPNLFEVELAFPSYVRANTETLRNSRFLVKAANLPASNINVIDVPFRGRNLKIAGDRTFDVWTITVINDTSFDIRNAFEEWMNGINKHDNATGVINTAQYQKDALVYQLGRNTQASTNGLPSNIKSGLPSGGATYPVLKKYVFHGVFPTNVSAIELSYDSSDTIEEFTVDLQVQWWDAYDANNDNLFSTEEQPIDTPDSQGS